MGDIMQKDFFEATRDSLHLLNQTERKLFHHIVKNMGEVKSMSIQKLAADRFLSTTTIFRFAKKLGFSGYSELINSLLITEHRAQTSEIPSVVQKNSYSEEYLKNVMEAIRVMPDSKVNQVLEVMERKPNVYIITDAGCHDIGRYCEKLFLGLGMYTYFPEVDYQVAAMLGLIKDDDLLIVLSYSGEDHSLINLVERILFEKRPFLLSLTRADNNTVQNMSDVNFYIFADEISFNGIDLTSRISMLMVLELLAYRKLWS
jgi:RpiR family glv operon transcriptional regulator